MFVAKDFARRRVASSRRYARIPARTHILARICATKQSRIESLATNIGTIPKNVPINFQLKRLKLNLDIVEKPANRVHKLTDSNGARSNVRSQGFCSASLFRTDLDMREFRRACTFWCVSARRSNLEQNPWLRAWELSQRTCLPIFSLNG